MQHAKLFETQTYESVKITQLHLQLKIHLSFKMCNSLCPAVDQYTKTKKKNPSCLIFSLTSQHTIHVCTASLNWTCAVLHISHKTAIAGYIGLSKVFLYDAYIS